MAVNPNPFPHTIQVKAETVCWAWEDDTNGYPSVRTERVTFTEVTDCTYDGAVRLLKQARAEYRQGDALVVEHGGHWSGRETHYSIKTVSGFKPTRGQIEQLLSEAGF